MKLFFLNILLLFSITISAQNAQDIIDNLKAELKTNPDEKKATIYADIAWYYATISIDSALVYSKKAISGINYMNDNAAIAQIYSDVASVYMRKSDFFISENYYNQAYDIRKKLGDTKGIAKINLNLGSVYMNSKKYKASVKSYLNALSYFENINDEQNINVIKSNLGLLNVYLKNYPKAIENLNQAILFAEKTNSKERLCEYYVNLGKAYYETDDLKKAEMFFNKSIENCKKSKNNTVLGLDYQYLSDLKIKQRKINEVEKNLELSRKFNDSLNVELDKANLNITVAKSYIFKNEFLKAKKILLNIKNKFEKTHSEIDLLNTYKLLIPVYNNLKVSDSVTFYFDKFLEIKDKIAKLNVEKQTIELETKYQTEKKEKLLIQKEAEAKEKNTTITILSLLAVIVGLIGFFIYRSQKQKANQKAKEVVLEKAISEIENQNKLQKQRLDISRDLHDNIGAQLTFITSSVENIKQGFELKDEKLNSKLSNISSFTKETITELRDTIWAMNHNQISFDDLKMRIINFIDKAKEADSKIDFKTTIDENILNHQLTSVEGMNIFRTIQEATNNSLKYAKASQINVIIQKKQSSIVIEIVDNGKGFNIETTEKGNGLVNMKKRISEINGNFSILSTENNGTKILIDLPVKTN